jgi:hypothetical protein
MVFGTTLESIGHGLEIEPAARGLYLVRNRRMSGHLRQMVIYEDADKLKLESLIFAPAWSVGLFFCARVSEAVLIFRLTPRPRLRQRLQRCHHAHL